MFQRQVDGRCPVCSTPDAACGPGAPSDPVITSDWGEVTPMAAEPLKVYDVKIGTTTVQMKLSEEDARRKGLVKDTPARKAPAKRKTSAKNKKLDVEPEATGGE